MSDSLNVNYDTLIPNNVGLSSDRRVLKALEKEKKLAADKIKCPKADDYKGTRLSRCLPSGEQCQACAAIYLEKHPATP